MDRLNRSFSILQSPARRVLAAVGIMICISTVSVAAAGEYVSRHKLQNLLRQGNINALEQTLAGLERAYKAGRISDDVIDHAYYVFASADPDFASQFTKWIAAKPRSHRALIARGMYRRNLGWVFRGDAVYSRLPKRRIDQMIRLFKVAEQDMNAALALKPDSGVSYGYLIEMQIAAGSVNKRDRLLRVGLKADPNSRAIRRNYFFGLLPWWGVGRSSVNDPNYPVALPDALRRFAATVERDAARRPDLQPLRGYLDYTAAEILHREARFQEAAEYYNRALSSGELATFHDKAGQNYYRLQRYDDAIASFNRALELRPNVPGYLKWRSWT